MASLYVNKYKSGWRVIEEVWTDGKRTQKTIPKESYISLGINPDWTVDEARQRVSEINARDSLKEAKVSSTRRVVNLNKADFIYLPREIINLFEKELIKKGFGSDTHKKKLLSRWEYVKEMIKELKLEASEYFDNRDLIYKYFITKQNSLDYSNKLISVLNMWGVFISKHQKRFFQTVPKPRGQIRGRIEDAYFDKPGDTPESDPLTPEILRSVKFNITENYNWMFISLWFGLRPVEVDSLCNPKCYEIVTLRGTQVLRVYQSKLTGVSREKRWKSIPILYPEQVEALRLIQQGVFKRPLMKTLKKVFLNHRITTYGGRKGFVDLMLDLGQALEDISVWLGHQSIETTWRKYRNKSRVNWKVS